MNVTQVVGTGELERPLGIWYLESAFEVDDQVCERRNYDSLQCMIVRPCGWSRAEPFQRRAQTSERYNLMSKKSREFLIGYLENGRQSLTTNY